MTDALPTAALRGVPGDAALPRLPGVTRETAADFAALYESTFRDLSGYCAALLRDDQAAIDVAQEAFTRLFARWRRVRDRRAFLFVVATNLVRDEWRRQARQAALIGAIGPLRQEAAPDPDGALRDAVLRLPGRLRDAAVLHLVLDLPVSDVARLLSVPEGTVKRRLHDARRRLRDTWTENR